MKANIKKEMNNGIIQYEIGAGNLPLKGNPLDADNFYPADGVEDADQGFYSEIFGLSKKERDARLARKKLASQSKAEARITKANAKQTKADAKVGQADAQKEQAKALGKDTTEGDVALANAIKTPEDKDKKSSPNYLLYGGIAVVVVGLGIFAYFKLRKKK